MTPLKSTLPCNNLAEPTLPCNNTVGFFPALHCTETVESHPIPSYPTLPCPLQVPTLSQVRRKDNTEYFFSLAGWRSNGYGTITMHIMHDETNHQWG